MIRPLSRLEAIHLHWIRVARHAAALADRAERAGNIVAEHAADRAFRAASRAARRAGDQIRQPQTAQQEALAA